jgi:hypothetical protein
MRKIDVMLLFGAFAIVMFLVAAPDKSTSQVPNDEAHQRFRSLVKESGKKTAEKYCGDCHNEEQISFPRGTHLSLDVYSVIN